MTWTDYIATAAFCFSIVSFAVSIFLERRTKATEQRLKQEELRLHAVARGEASKAALLQSLQGEKESVGFTALHIARNGLPDDQSDREQVILALVQAAVFAGSDRARAMIYAVLGENSKQHGREIHQTVLYLDQIFKRMESLGLDQRELDLAAAGGV